MRDGDFEAALDEYQANLAESALDAEERSWTVAARPDAVPTQIPFADLRVGDYITADGRRWARVVDLRGSYSRINVRQLKVPADHVSVLFEVPESSAISGETRYWIDRLASESVTVDGACSSRRRTEPAGSPR